MKQNQVRILVAGILILIIIAILVLFQKDISKLMSTPKKDTPQRHESKVDSKIMTLDDSEPDPKKGFVEASSEMSSYDLLFYSRKRVVDILYSWGIYNKKYDLNDFGKNTGGVNTIKFMLVKKPQKPSSMGLQSHIQQSTVEVYAVDNSLEVKIYFSDNAFPDIKGYIDGQALFGLYILSHPFSPTEIKADLEAKFSKILTENIKGVPLFNVVKNTINK
jgi:hypothetical protein